MFQKKRPCQNNKDKIETIVEKIVDSKINKNKKKLKFIDLFCGIGGFHQALDKLNFECVFACDIDDSCIDTYYQNYNIKPFKDITKLDVKNIPSFDILCAGWPCQPFSKSGFQKGFNDSRGTLFYDICKIVKYHKPKYLILENVRNLESHDNGNTWKTIYSNINKLGYNTYEKPLILNALHFNVPQNRERVIIICKRNDIGKLNIRPNIPKINKKELKISLKTVMDKKYNKDNILNEKLKNVKMVWNNFIKICNNNNITIPKFPIWTDWWDCELDQNNDKYKKYTNLINKNRTFYNSNKKILVKWLTTSRKNKFWFGSVRKLEWQTSQNNVLLDDLLWSLRGSGVRVKDTNYVPTLVALNQTPIYGPYITTQIIDVVLSNGHPDIVFNLQYTNPNKDNYRPGPPLKQLSIEEKQWLTDHGFRVQEIVECFNVSTSCEFVCHGDGVGKLRITWEMTGSFIKDCINLFTIRV